VAGFPEMIYRIKTIITMKQLFFFTCLILLAAIGHSQNVDSLLAEPQTIELTISTPQPRLHETFQISIDINHLRANIFKSLAGKLQLSNDIGTTDNSELTLNVTALHKGRNEIGPLEFYLDKTKYTTNKINFEVVDALPNVDKGIWFRKVITGESTFCIIIEQRIPATTKTTKLADNSITFTTEPEYTKIVKFKDSYSIPGLSGSNSRTSTNFSSITVNGKELQFMYGYSVYHFRIEDKNARISIKKEVLENLPRDYVFEEIIVQ